MANVTSTQSSFLANQTILETSLLNFEEDTDYQYLEYMRYVSMVCFSITFLLGVMGNGLVIWIGTFKMTRTVNVIWFFNLAIADFIFDVCLPLHIVSTAVDGHWPFGSIMCKISNMALWLNMLASITFLVVISIDRCVSVMNPSWSRNHRTPRLANMIVFAIWLLALIFSSPYPAFYDITPSSLFENHTYTYCYMSYAIPWDDISEKAMTITDTRHSIMIITRFVSMFLVPFAIITICYGVIALKIKQRKHQAKSSRPFKIIITILVLFFICRFPFHSLPLFEMVEFQSTWWIKLWIAGSDLATCLAYANTCLNPILYVFMGRSFKDMLRRSILSVFERAFNDEPARATLDISSPSKYPTEVESQLL